MKKIFWFLLVFAIVVTGCSKNDNEQNKSGITIYYTNDWEKAYLNYKKENEKILTKAYDLLKKP